MKGRIYMNIFKKRSKKTSNVSCCAKCASAETKKPCETQKNDVATLSIKVLGSGCKNCRTLLDNVNQAVLKGSLNANVEYITDLKHIAGYGVISMPALVINESVVSAGKVLKADEINKLIKPEMSSSSNQ